MKLSSLFLIILGIAILPALGWFQYFATVDDSSFPKWSFYIGILCLLAISVLMNYIFSPTKRMKAFLTGVASLFAIHGVIVNAFPKLSDDSAALAERLNIISTPFKSYKVIPDANANKPIPFSHHSPNTVSLVFKSVNDKKTMLKILNNSDLRITAFRDTLGRPRAVKIPEENIKIDDNGNAVIFFPVRKDEVALQFRSGKNDPVTRALTSEHERFSLTTEFFQPGDFFWALGFNRSKIFLDINQKSISFSASDRSFSSAKRGILLSEWDEVFDGALINKNIGIELAVVLATYGATKKDDKFHNHTAVLRNTGIVISPAHSVNPAQSAKLQLSNFKKELALTAELSGIPELVLPDNVTVMMRTRNFIDSYETLKRTNNLADLPLVASEYFGRVDEFIGLLRADYKEKQELLEDNVKPLQITVAFEPMKIAKYLPYFLMEDYPNIAASNIWLSDIKDDGSLQYHETRKAFKMKVGDNIGWLDEKFHIPNANVRHLHQLGRKFQLFTIAYKN